MEKNRKTFIAQLMSFAAINSLASVPVCSVGRDLAAGGYSTLVLRLLQPLLSSVVIKKTKRVACCVNQLSCILHLLSNWA